MNLKNLNWINLSLAILTFIFCISIKFNPPSWISYADPYDYLQQSEEGLFSKSLYFPKKTEAYYPRPFTTPLLYKMVNSNPEYIIYLQKFFHALSAFVFCSAIFLFLKNKRAKILFMAFWYFLMSWWNIVNWTNAVLSESLSISLFFIWLASFLYFIHKKSIPTLLLHLFVTILFSFTRDSWPYVICLFYLMTLIIAIKTDRKLAMKMSAIVVFSVFLFFMQQETAKIGQRYRLPIMNNIVHRVLPNEEYANWFVSQGMPNASELKAEYADINNPKKIYDLYTDKRFETFSNWVVKKGKSVYMKFLFTHPENLFLLNEKKENLNKIFAFNVGYGGNIAGYSYISHYILPIFNTISILGLNILLLFIYAKERKLIWLLPTLLIILFTFNAILLYIADSLEIERHLYMTQIMIQVIGILLLAFIVDSNFFEKTVNKFKRSKSNFQRNN